jgi:hypothetical protein
LIRKSIQYKIPKYCTNKTKYLESGCVTGEEASGFARAMLNKALGFLLKQCQTYEQLEGDCSIYKRPQKKQPRVEDTLPDESRYEDGSYFPSGSSASGMPGAGGQEQAVDQQKDDWTSINNSVAEENNQGMVEAASNNNVNKPDQQTNFETQPPPPAKPEPFIPQDFQAETPKNSQESSFPSGGEGGRSRQPWIPSADIQAFDDIFNSVERTRAQELSSTAVKTLRSSKTIFVSCLAGFVAMLL